LVLHSVKIRRKKQAARSKVQGRKLRKQNPKEQGGTGNQLPETGNLQPIINLLSEIK